LKREAPWHVHGCLLRYQHLSLQLTPHNNKFTPHKDECMMPSDDILEHAKSDKDFYALIGFDVTPNSSDKDIARAYRRSALKSHPDQNPDDPTAVERFHLLQIAYDVLSDPAAKAAYDNARAARELRKRQNAMLDNRRRKMKEDLERRESGSFKRKRDEPDAEDILEREIRRLAEDGRRRRMERQEALRKEAEAEARKREEVEANGHKAQIRPTGGTNVPEMSRSVKVRWAREGAGVDMDKDTLEKLFKEFGKIEGVLLLPDRKTRLAGERKKRMIATGVIIFTSIVGAHAAVEDLKNQTGDEWKVFEKIEWAEGKEPDFGQSTDSAPTTPDTRPAKAHRTFFPGLDSAPSTPLTPLSGFKDGGGLRKVPSFASFSSANFGSPGPQSPSLEEITLIRLKNAEKKRLEEQIRKREAEEQ
jgi:DnaJ homolog subfamily C member 17